MVLDGLLTTVEIAVIGLLIVIPIGTLLAVAKFIPKYKVFPKVSSVIADAYVGLFRGTPMVVQLLLAYYVFLPLCGAKNVNALVVGIIVFGLNSGAYVSEIMRGGINSVDRSVVLNLKQQPDVNTKKRSDQFAPPEKFFLAGQDTTVFIK